MKNLYIACIVAKDSAGDYCGLARPVIAESEEEALGVADAAFVQNYYPDVSSMDTKLRTVQEIPRSFVEQLATKVLGWSSPVKSGT